MVMFQRAPIVSVVIPAYRCEQILARALGSLLAQTFREWEAVIVDDGSPEASWGVIQAYTWLDPRIRAIRQEHRGVCATRNAGIAEARGTFLLFLDADDWLEDDALNVLVQACENNGWVASIGGVDYALPDGTMTEWSGGLDAGTSLFEGVFASNGVCVPSAILLRRSLIDQIGMFDPTLIHCGDWDMWARVGRHAGESGRVGQIVTAYRMSPGSLSRNPRTLLRDAITVMRRVHAADPRALQPNARWIHGADARHLDSRIAHFGVYTAALAAAHGNLQRVEGVLDSVSRWPALDVVCCAEFVYYALCFSKCAGPESFRDFWADVAACVGQLFNELQRRSDTAGLSDALWHALEDCAGAKLPIPVPVDDSNDLPVLMRDRGWETYEEGALLALARRGSA
jgi:hypothetical protein